MKTQINELAVVQLRTVPTSLLILLDMQDTNTMALLRAELRKRGHQTQAELAGKRGKK